MLMMTSIPTLHTNIWIFTVEQTIMMQSFLTLVLSLGIPSLSGPVLESLNFILCIIHMYGIHVCILYIMQIRCNLVKDLFIF